jgi:hypothetical protein
MDDGIYIPVSDRTLRKLDQLVSIFATSGEGYSEDRILGMCLDNLLASMRQFENDNFPAPPPTDAYPSGHTAADGRPALGASNSEMPAG